MAGSGRRTQYRKYLTDSVLNDLPEPNESIGRHVGLVIGTRGGNMFDVLVAAPPSTSGTNNHSMAETLNDCSLRDDNCTGGNDSNNDNDNDDANDQRSSKGGGAEIPPPSTTTAPTMMTTKDNDDVRNNHPPMMPIQHTHVRRSNTPQLAFLPTKFRKLIWIKRNDYVIVECGDAVQVDDNRAGSGEDASLLRVGGKSERDTAITTTTTMTSVGSSGVGFRCVITNILYKDQVKHIKSRGMWPSDPLFNDDDGNDKVAMEVVVVDPPSTADVVASRVRQNKRTVVEGRGCSSTEVGDDRLFSNDTSDEDDVLNGDDLPSTNQEYYDGTYVEDGIVYDDPLREELVYNTNRVAALRVEDTSSDDDEE